MKSKSVQFSSVQSLSCVWLFATLWITACQASLSITNSRSLPKFMSIKSVMPSSHLILCGPLLLLPTIPPSIRVFSIDSTLRMRWPKCWSFSFSVSPSNEQYLGSNSTSTISRCMTSVCVLCAWSLSQVRLFATPWTVVCQALLSMGIL